MWTTIKAWLDKHSISSKTLVTVWLFLDGAYYTMPAFHDFVTNTYAHIPKDVHALIAGVVIPLLVFWKTTHSSSAVAAPLNPQTPLNLKGDK